eukprot:3934813-Rhodomonas_salina.8
MMASASADRGASTDRKGCGVSVAARGSGEQPLESRQQHAGSADASGRRAGRVCEQARGVAAEGGGEGHAAGSQPVSGVCGHHHLREPLCAMRGVRSVGTPVW